jgi:NAD(P)-dependent dehydrogenase (short-subunit alcohol dehydrogenase family)
MKKAITEIARIHEHIDCLIYSAGRTPDVAVPLMKYEPEEFAKTFDVYVRGFLHAFQITLPHMTCGGHIVILGSAVTRFPSDHLPPIYAGHYAAAKAALAELAKWARREAHQKNVLLSLVAPGAVDTATHCIGALSQIPKNLLSIETLTAAILGMVLNGIEGDLQMVA